MSVPAAFERHLVPHLFEPWANDLLNAIALRRDEALLDVACRTCVLTQALSRGRGSARTVGCDVSGEILRILREKCALQHFASAELVRAAAWELPFADGEFDVVTCHHGLQFFLDRLGALAEMHRVLRPGGRIGVAVWDGIESAPLWRAAQHAVMRAGLPLAAALMDGPYSYGSPAKLERELRTARFRDVVVRTKTLPMVLDGGIEEAVEMLEATPMWQLLRDEPSDVRAAVKDAARDEFTRFLHYGKVFSHNRAHVAVARKAAPVEAGAVG